MASVTMLNVLKLSELLTKNVDPKLYPRIFIMAPNGTLIAYSTPIDIKALRDQAALISMAWKDHEAAQQAKALSASANDPDSHPTERPESRKDTATLETLSIEFQQNNIIVRALQPQLLLVLVGTVPPNRKEGFKMTAEAVGDPRYPPLTTTSSSTQNPNPTAEEGNDNLPQADASHTSPRDQDIHLGALHIQRKKMDALSEYIRRDFRDREFVMPDDAGFP